MARGFFRAPTNNIDVFTQNWLKEHPNAVVVPVSISGPTIEANPDSKMIFVWIVDGTESLNLALVRQGCMPGSTQMLPANEKLQVRKSDYDEFINKVVQMDRDAQMDRIGIWKEEVESKWRLTTGSSGESTANELRGSAQRRAKPRLTKCNY